MTFLEELKQQRWDDHRYYHHSRINQSLHFVSAMSFVACYALAAANQLAAAGLIGWIIAMWSRQIGHFFFEPRGYDEVNHASHEHKEEIKVGYNLRRKVVLLAIWILLPVWLYFEPTMFGLFTRPTGGMGFVENVAILWLLLGLFALLFRTVHLFFIRGVQTGLVWFTKILTDPFHDIKIYHRAPAYLMRGELIDPMLHTPEHSPHLADHR